MEEVKIYRGTPYNDTNGRGIIDGTVFEKGVMSQTKDICLITFPPGSRKPTEGHYHPKKYEFFVILGKISKKEKGDPLEAVILRFKKAGRLGFEEVTLNVGDSCYVPAGYSHAFKPKRDRLCIVCIANKEPSSQKDEDTVPDKLFW